MAHVKGEDKFLAEPDVQQLTTRERVKRPRQSGDDFDAEFSGDLLGCFAVFDGVAHPAPDPVADLSCPRRPQ